MADCIDDLITELKKPRDVPNTFETLSADAQVRELARREQFENLIKHIDAEAKTKNMSWEEVARAHNLPFSWLWKNFREHLYPAFKFSWENVEPDVVRNRLKEREIYSSVKTEAARSGRSINDVLKARNISPDVYRNLEYQARTDDTLARLGGNIRNLRGLNERSNFLFGETQAIETTGTIRPGSKETFREDVRKQYDTYARKVSEKDVDIARSQVIESAQGIRDIARQQQSLGPNLTAHQAGELADRMAGLVKEYDSYALKWERDRMAAGRTLRAYQRPPVPLDVLEALEKAGATVAQWRNAPQRMPVLTSVGGLFKSWMPGGEKLTPSQHREATSNLVQAPRLGLFPVSSWTLDSMLDLAEAGTQTIAAFGADLGRAIDTGKLTFPNTKGAALAYKDAFYRTINRHYTPELYNPHLEARLGMTASGEPMSGNLRLKDLVNWNHVTDFAKPEYYRSFFKEGMDAGFFKTGQMGAGTYRTSQASAALDTVWGVGMYAKGAADMAFKRLAGSMSLKIDALKAAEAAGIDAKAMPLQHADFIRKFLDDIPQDALQRAVDYANEAGFSRELNKWQEWMSRSKTGQLFVDAFGRFGWQFMRWTQDMLGGNPAIWRKISDGVKEGKWGLSGEETGRWLFRAATGWGGIALLDGWLRDRTDFNSMEYVKENGDRVRLSGREPIASALMISSTFHAMQSGKPEDWAKVEGAMRYASFPLVKLYFGGGGLLSNLMTATTQASMSGRSPFTDKQTIAEIVDTVNHAIPGQAVFGFLKTLTDPTVREGLGANLPGVSQFLPPKIDLTTGEPVQPRQSIPAGPLGDVRFPAVQGVAVPGFAREVNPVAQMLMKYGLGTYRAARQPIAGEPPSQAPAENVREWQTQFGQFQNQFLTRLMPAIQQIEARTPAAQLQPQQPVYEAIKARIQSYQAMADRLAREQINAKYGTPSKLPRQTTPREARMPIER